MIRLKHAEFGDNEVIVSIGFFSAPLAEVLMVNCFPEYVEAYDPNDDVHKKYQGVAREHSKFVPVAKAISDKSGSAMLMGARHNSTIYAHPKARLRPQHMIEVVAFDDVIRSVFKRFGRVDRVVLNCEGAEIPIIRQAETLDLCKYVFVQFHTFADTLAVTKPDVEECLSKLSRTHNMKLVHLGRCEHEGYLK